MRQLLAVVCIGLFLASSASYAQSAPVRRRPAPARRQAAPPPPQEQREYVPRHASTPDIWVGVGLGPNFSSITDADDPGATVSGNTQFQVKGFIDWHLTDIWYVSTGLRYNSYGEHEEANGAKISYDIHYLEVPVLVKPMFDAGGWYPYLLAGPNFGFKVSEGVDASAGGQNFSASTSIAKSFNFSMDFGLGVEVPLTPEFRIFGEFEYALGLTKAVSDDTSNDSPKTRGALLTFGIAAGF